MQYICISKKLLSVFLIGALIVGGLHASANTDDHSSKESQSMAFDDKSTRTGQTSSSYSFQIKPFLINSLAIGAIAGAACALVDRKTQCEALLFTWLVSCGCREAVIDAINYQYNNSDIRAIVHARATSSAASWLAWALVYFGLSF